MFVKNFFIRVGIQTYMNLGFASFLNLQRLTVNNFSDCFSVGMASVCFFFFFFLPLYSGIVLYRKHRNDTWHIRECNELYAGLKKNLPSRMYYMIFFFRRFMMVIGPFITRIQLFQISYQVSAALFYTCYLL